MVRLYQVLLNSEKVRAQMTQLGCWNKLEGYLDNMIQQERVRSGSGVDS